MSAHRIMLPLAALALIVGCSSPSDQASSTETTQREPAATAVTVATNVTSTAAEPAPAPTFEVRPGPAQVAIIDAPVGSSFDLVAADGVAAGTGRADEMGSLLWRQLEPGEYRVVPADGPPVEVTVVSFDDLPDPDFYSGQELPAGGFGYLTVRDGTTLSINVILPDAGDAPYPTVVEYSGYSPSDPDASGLGDLFTALGYAYVGVNIRGTGCSGGSFQYFEPIQSTDGYDVIETIAAQPWVAGHHVGMVGISYSGISQLFVAQTQPPALAAITPLSVLDDSYAATLYPGGMLNTGFAVPWAAERQAQAAPFGQGWTKERADGGDETCAENQRLRLQNPDQLELISANPDYRDDLYDWIAPRLFVDNITVPVFLAGAWQDEQTGGHFPTMLDRFTGTPHLYATLVNGLHTEALSPAILTEYLEFLSLYVREESPALGIASLALPALGDGLFGVPDLVVPPSQLDGLDFAAALAAYEARPAVRVLFEQGAAEGVIPGAPVPRFEARFDSWPIAAAEARTWYLTVGGVLADEPGGAGDPTASYVADPDAVPATFYGGGGSSEIWRADVVYDWPVIPGDHRSSWTTAPLAADTTVVGSGSVDLWLRSSAADTDLEVTVSEVRPDGSETYVQSGWLRATKRALDDAASTPTRPVHPYTADANEPLPTGEFSEARVEIFPFAHPFRAGSRIRVTLAAPGGNRPVWVFDTLPGGETNEIGQSAERPSRLVLNVLPALELPPGVPACGALRGQPCRAVAG